MAKEQVQPYRHQHFPKHLYLRGAKGDLLTLTVSTPDEFDKAIGRGAVESPADLPDASTEDPETALANENAELRRQLAALQAKGTPEVPQDPPASDEDDDEADSTPKPKTKGKK